MEADAWKYNTKPQSYKALETHGTWFNTSSQSQHAFANNSLQLLLVTTTLNITDFKASEDTVSKCQMQKKYIWSYKAYCSEIKWLKWQNLKQGLLDSDLFPVSYALLIQKDLQTM